VPKLFYISNVTDTLDDKAGIGTITDGGKQQKLVIHGGGKDALKDFISKNVTQDKSKQAVVLHVAKLDIDIKKKGTTWTINAAMTVTFYAGGIKIIQYSGRGKAENDNNPMEYAENFIRRSIEQNLKRFDEYWAEHKNDIPISEAVKVNVTIAKTMDKPNNIVYSTKRQLQISDFAGRPQDDAVELAATYSGISFSTTGTTEKGQLVINVILTPYFDKAKSWFKEAGKNAVLLAHEQAHFDITAIKTCELAEAIKKAEFTKDNYLSLFDELQKKYIGESNDEQNTYDNETRHGTISNTQQAWQKRIALKVRAVGCY